MDITGIKVKHKAFGTGTVASVSGEHLIVSFDIGEKTFIYPDAFFNFLSVDDVEVHKHWTIYTPLYLMLKQ